MEKLLKENNNFVYYGKDFSDDILNIIENFRLQNKNAVLVTGQKSFNQSFFKNKFLKLLLKKKINIFKTVKISPNPKIKDLQSLKIEKRQVDLIICVGGGSVIDFGKLLKLKKHHQAVLFVIYTLPGSGSIVTPFTIYDNGEFKIGEHSEDIVPDIAYINEDIIDKIPIEKKIMALCDIFAHAIESQLSLLAGKESTKLSKKALDMLFEAKSNISSIKVKKFVEADVFAARAESHALVLFPHAVGHYLTYKYKIPHAVASMYCMREYLELLRSKGCKFLKESMNFANRLVLELEEGSLFPVLAINDLEKEKLMSLIKKYMSFSLDNAPVDITDDEYLKILNKV